MRVDNSLLDGIATSSSATKSTAKSHKSSPTSSFSSALKSATSDADSTSTSSAAETTKPVDGHPYADILTGPRAGLYLNTSANKRAGETFVMVNRNGREYHIYGTGKDRTVIGLKTAAERKAATSSPTGTTGTTTDTTTSTGTTDTGKINTDTSTTSGG